MAEWQDYMMNSRILGSSEDQWYLGVHVHQSLKVAGQVDKVVKKTYGTLLY